jgi:hypothetical protein
MTSRFEAGVVGQPNLEVHVFDEQWRRIAPVDDPIYQEVLAAIVEDEAIGPINALSVEKPGWFVGLEQEARGFMTGLGFAQLPPIFLLKEGQELEALDMLGDHQSYAITDWLNRYAVIRQKKVAKSLIEDGRAKATSVVVHELAHLSMEGMSYTIQRDKNGGYDGAGYVKSGLMFAGDEIVRGSFFEEGFAAYITGMFVRSAEGEESLISFLGQPAAYLPNHYRLNDDNTQSFGENVTGPDGYALELLMWACEQKHVMPSNEFFANLLASRRLETQAEALRNLIYAINSIDNQLYPKLSRLKYGEQDWHDGCAFVYEAVTGKLWPDRP